MDRYALSKSDYISILKYYNIPFKQNMSIKKIRTLSENILARKMCKCIKQVKRKTLKESNSIAICKKSIFQNKNIDFFRFSCKKKNKLIPKKNTTIKLIKYKNK
jgi:hypothetical protein